jgi:hypothetical protein
VKGKIKMSISQDHEVTPVADGAQDYLFVLGALRTCTGQDGFTDWESYLRGDVYPKETNPIVKNVNQVVVCYEGDVAQGKYKLDQLVEKQLDPKAVHIIMATTLPHMITGLPM